jgi:Domain of Unknown Function (DUF1080)
MICHGLVSRIAFATGIALSIITLASTAQSQEYKSGRVWPEPKLVDPGPPGGVPADAIVLFDGTDMSAWKGADDWPIKDGAVTVKRGPKSNLGYAETKQAFGDCQLHIEFCEPEVVRGSGQGRGNSGVFLMGKYELQVLDSYNNPTYYDGQCGAMYKQHPPLVNVSRKPGEWQTYDVVWEAPKFEDGKVVKPAFITVLQNGVVVQAHQPLEGSTLYDHPPHYEPHAAKEPLRLQDHGNPVRFRNIWIRELTPINYSMEGKPAYQ